MANNINKIDQLHNLMPSHYNTRTNPNWNALITALGTSDQNVADLIALIKQQFFVKTASGTYLNNLGANSGVARPAGVGMQDPEFRKYIPILAYTPKQVKLIVDKLLSIFFAPETTTSYIISGRAAPYTLQDGWTLEYTVDGIYDELVVFRSSDFTDINAATATEVAAAINRQAQHSNAEDYFDHIAKSDTVKIFTNTVGSKGSVEMIGGLANIALQFNGFIVDAGTGNNTQWTLSKVGNQVTYQWVGGMNPNINLLDVGDIIFSLLPGNVGYFNIDAVDLSTGSFTVTNLFGTAGSFTQTSADQTKFMRPTRSVVWGQINRAIAWETTPGEAIIEMPATPPIVKRNLIGSAHINGATSVVTAYNNNTSVTVANAQAFPMSGSFWFQEIDELQSPVITPLQNTLSVITMNTRLQGSPTKYTFDNRLVLDTTGDTLAGSNTITNLASVIGVAVGQNVFMVGVPSYALVTGILGSSVTIDHPATATGTGSPVQFGGSTLVGISPPLPALATTDIFPLTSLTRSGNVVTATTSGTHNYKVGQVVFIYGSSGITSFTATGNVITGFSSITGVTPTPVTVSSGELVSDGGVNITPGTLVTGVFGTTVNISLPAIGTGAPSLTFSENLNGSFVITSVTSNTFTYDSVGLNGTATTPGSSLVENMGLASIGHEIIITDALPASFTRIPGSYVWNLSAPFVLSSNTASLINNIQAGQTVPLLNLTQNTIPAAGGYVVFDYGLNTQEGPVKYLYAPNNTALVLDPSYIFQHNHSIGGSVISIDNFGPHIMSGIGTEYASYITNPSDVRITLEQLIKSVTSAGIFIDFLIRYPQQLYSVLPTYTVT